jgi:hypothetical protein
MLHIIGIIIAAYVVIGLLGFWQGVRPDEVLQRSQMHMATWTDLLHMAIDRRRQRRKQRAENGAAKSSGDPGDARSDDTGVFWALALIVVFLAVTPHGFIVASIIAASCIGGVLVIGVLTGRLGHIHRALIEKPVGDRLSAFIRHPR